MILIHRGGSLKEPFDVLLGGDVRNVLCEKIAHLLWLVFDDAYF